MPLQPQFVEIPLIKGVDQKIDPKQLPIGKLLIAENCEFQKPGKIQKRNGFQALGRGIVGDGIIEDGQAVMNYGNELLAFDQNNIYSYIEGTNNWNDKGDYVSTYLTSKHVSNSTSRDFSNDSARHSSGLECYVFTRQDGSSGVYQIYYSVLDGNTGQTIVAPTLISNDGLTPQVVAFKNTFVIFYYNTADTRLYRGVLPIGNIKQVVTFDYITGDSADVNSVQDNTYPVYFVNVVTTNQGGEQLYLTFNNRSPSNGTTLRNYLVPSQQNPTSQATQAFQCRAASIFYDPYYDAPVFVWATNQNNSGRIWIFIYTPNLVDSGGSPVALWYSFVNEVTLDSFFPENVVHVTGISKSSTSLDIDIYWDTYLFYPVTYKANLTQASVASLGPFPQANHNQVFNSNNTNPSNEDWKIPNVALASQAFAYGGKSYVATIGGLIANVDNLSYFIINQNGQVFSKAYAGLGSGIYFDSATTPYSFWLPKVNSVSDSKRLISFVVKNTFGKVGTRAVTGISALNIDFYNQEKSYSRNEISDNLFIGGGLLYAYDSVSLVEAGFNYPPEITIVTATSSSATGSSYQYKAVYEWVDQQGNLNYSAPSPAFTRKVAYPIGVSGSYATASVKCLTLTEKTTADGRSPVMIALYRTTENGQSFYRLPITTQNQNIPQSSSINISDNTTDSVLVGGVPLYTDGGALEADQAPPVGGMTIYRNRLFVLDSTNPLVIYPSKEVTPLNPVEFNIAQYINVDPTGGPCSGLATLDDKLIIFKESSIRYLAGNGPDNNGEGSDYGQQNLITTDAGCTNLRSIVVTPEGLIFKSKKGIYLLNRGLQVSYIGAPVENYNDRFITSAQLLKEKNQVRFTLDNNVALVYDYFVDAWAVFTNINAVDSIIWDNKQTYIRSSGQVLRETLGVYTDETSPISMKIQTSWLNFGGIQGYQRWWNGYVLGTWKSPHRLKVDLNYDFNDSYYQQIIVSPQPLYTYGSGSYGVSGSVYGGVNELYQYRVNPERQRCMSVKMTIQDIPDASGSFGAGVELSNLRFEYGVEKLGNRLKTAKQFG